MMLGFIKSVLCAKAGFFALLLLCSAVVEAANPQELLLQLNDYPHAQQVAQSEQEVIDHEIGLGALQKVRGAWRFKNSERLNGVLLRYTWQVVDGFTSIEVMEELIDSMEMEEATRLLFSCEGRACGKGVQWANRVFQQRVLYGRDDFQRYRVYALQADTGYRLVIYSSSRTADRQYLHVDLLRIAE